MGETPTYTTITLSWPRAIAVLLAVVLGLVALVGLPMLAISKLGFWVSTFYFIFSLFVLIAAGILVSAFKKRSREEAKGAGTLLGIAGLLMVVFVGLRASRSDPSGARLFPQSSGRDWASASNAERRRVCELVSERMQRTGAEVTPTFLNQALTEYFDGAGSQDSIASAAGLCAALAGH